MTPNSWLQRTTCAGRSTQTSREPEFSARRPFRGLLPAPSVPLASRVRFPDGRRSLRTASIAASTQAFGLRPDVSASVAGLGANQASCGRETPRGTVVPGPFPPPHRVRGNHRRTRPSPAGVCRASDPGTSRHPAVQPPAHETRRSQGRTRSPLYPLYSITLQESPQILERSLSCDAGNLASRRVVRSTMVSVY